MDAPWRIELLGWLRATQGDHVVSRFRAQKTGALLAYLAFFRQRSHSREELIELLWPEAAPRSGRNNLSRELNSLRHQLEPPGVPAGAVIVATRDWVQLNPAACVTDVAQFEVALQAAARVLRAEERIRWLTEAMALYGGELLPGYFEEWILPERQRLAEAHLQALGQLIQCLEQQGDLPHALQRAHQAVAVDPLREEAHQDLIHLLTAAGRPEAALRQYRELERLLEAAGGIVPADAIRSLARELEAGSVAPGDGTAEQPTAIALPVCLLNISSPSGPPAIPPVNLPLQFTRFFGREREIEQLQALLLALDVRLMTLTGPGGSGKTRLAREVAGRLWEPLEGAIWFVPLLDLASAHLILDRIMDILRLPRSPQVEPLEQIVAVLSRRPVLLLLDNFEHLVTEGAIVVTTLLERLPRLTLLVTSRQRLGLPGEREFPVAPLPTPPQAPLLSGEGEMTDASELLHFHSVQLFVDRAQAVRPDFQVSPRNAAVVAGLCQRLEGLPLALELAAARIGVLTPGQILARLEQRFDLLVSRNRLSDPRHRSLRAALDWSYQLLSPELQRFFARLSVFRGGWTLEAAEAVCEELKAWEYLEQLRECSLVQAEEVEGEMRFRLLETLREYGAEQLTADETTALRRRHASFFLAMAETAEPKLTGGEQEEWLARLEREHGNLRAALEWVSEAASCPDGCQEREVGLRFAGALWQFWDIRGYSVEGRAWLERLLALPGAERRTPERARALHAAGWLSYALSDYGSARAFAEESLSMAQELSDRWNVAASIYTLASVARDQGDYTAARSLYEESLALWRVVGDRSGAAACLCDLGLVANALGSFEVARTHFEESLALCRQIGDRRGVARSLRYLGVIAYGHGDYTAARSLYEESLAIQQALGDRGGVTQSLFHLGGVALQQNDNAAARALFEASLALAREMGDKGDIAAALGNLGHMARREGESGRALALFEEVLALYREQGDRRGMAGSLENLGHLALDRSDWQAAGSFCAESLAIRREIGQKRGIAESLEDLATVANGKGQAELAARLFAAAAALRQQIGAPIQAADRADYERHVAATRAALGEAAYAAAWTEGEAMAMEQAITCALKVVDND